MKILSENLILNRVLFIVIVPACQCSARGGELRVSILKNGRVVVAGPAIIVLRGHIKYS
jgi:hypothetical protein